MHRNASGGFRVQGSFGPVAWKSERGRPCLLARPCRDARARPRFRAADSAASQCREVRTRTSLHGPQHPGCGPRLCLWPAIDRVCRAGLASLAGMVVVILAAVVASHRSKSQYRYRCFVTTVDAGTDWSTQRPPQRGGQHSRGVATPRNTHGAHIWTDESSHVTDSSGNCAGHPCTHTHTLARVSIVH